MTTEPQTIAIDPQAEKGAAAAAAVFWGCLSRALLRPTVDLAADILGGKFAETLGCVVDASASEVAARALEVFQGLAGEGDAERLRLELEVEYNRLFVGPFKVVAPPYESYHMSAGANGEGGRLRTQDEFDVRAAYSAHGYAMPEEFVDLPDHAAIELEFLALLARDEAAAWEAGDTERALSLRQAADDFAAAHPCRWFAALTASVADGARTPFYPAVLGIACTVLGI